MVRTRESRGSNWTETGNTVRRINPWSRCRNWSDQKLIIYGKHRLCGQKILRHHAELNESTLEMLEERGIEYAIPSGPHFYNKNKAWELLDVPEVRDELRLCPQNRLRNWGWDRNMSSKQRKDYAWGGQRKCGSRRKFDTGDEHILPGKSHALYSRASDGRPRAASWTMDGEDDWSETEDDLDADCISNDFVSPAQISRPPQARARGDKDGGSSRPQPCPASQANGPGNRLSMLVQVIKHSRRIKPEVQQLLEQQHEKERIKYPDMNLPGRVVSRLRKWPASVKAQLISEQCLTRGSEATSTSTALSMRPSASPEASSTRLDPSKALASASRNENELSDDLNAIAQAVSRSAVDAPSDMACLERLPDALDTSQRAASRRVSRPSSPCFAVALSKDVVSNPSTSQLEAVQSAIVQHLMKSNPDSGLTRYGALAVLICNDWDLGAAQEHVDRYCLRRRGPEGRRASGPPEDFRIPPDPSLASNITPNLVSSASSMPPTPASAPNTQSTPSPPPTSSSAPNIQSTPSPPPTSSSAPDPHPPHSMPSIIPTTPLTAPCIADVTVADTAATCASGTALGVSTASHSPVGGTERRECPICLTDGLPESCGHEVPGCGHWFCDHCFGNYLRFQTPTPEDKSNGMGCFRHLDAKAADPLTCPLAPGCRYLVDPVLTAEPERCSGPNSMPQSRCQASLAGIRKRLEDQAQQLVKTDLLAKAGHNAPCMPCPKCSNVLFRGEPSGRDMAAAGAGGAERTCAVGCNVQCVCGAVVCMDCRDEGHFPATCEETKLAKQALGTVNAVVALGGGDVNFCPHCDNLIEKNGGCKHMVCVCGHAFCWGCGGAWVFGWGGGPPGTYRCDGSSCTPDALARYRARKAAVSSVLMHQLLFETGSQHLKSTSAAQCRNKSARLRAEALCTQQCTLYAKTRSEEIHTAIARHSKMQDSLSQQSSRGTSGALGCDPSGVDYWVKMQRLGLVLCSAIEATQSAARLHVYNGPACFVHQMNTVIAQMVDLLVAFDGPDYCTSSRRSSLLHKQRNIQGSHMTCEEHRHHFEMSRLLVCDVIRRAEDVLSRIRQQGGLAMS